jgi:hypothetical protein
MESYLISGQPQGVMLHAVVTTAVGDDYGRQMLTAMFAEVNAAFAQTARLLSPYEMHMAAFHLRLLQEELLKSPADGRPSADILMLAATWLLARVRGFAPDLSRLLFSVVAAEVISRAGETAVTWLENRAANYEAEGQRLNLVQLRHGLAHFAESDLRELCSDVGLVYDQLYGHSKSEKAQEMVACAVCYGRVLELAARCLERRPYSGKN